MSVDCGDDFDIPEQWYKDRAKVLSKTTGFRQLVRYRNRQTHEPVCFAWQNLWMEYPKHIAGERSMPLTLLPYEGYIATKITSKWIDASKQHKAAERRVTLRPQGSRAFVDLENRQLFFVAYASPKPMVSCFAFYFCDEKLIRILVQYAEDKFDLEADTTPLTPTDGRIEDAEATFKQALVYLFEHEAT